MICREIHKLSVAYTFPSPCIATLIVAVLQSLEGKDEGGGVGGFQHGMPCTWQLPWLAVEWPWSAPTGPFLTFLAQMGVETSPLHLYVHHFRYCRFWSAGAFAGQRPLTIESLLMSGSGRS